LIVLRTFFGDRSNALIYSLFLFTFFLLEEFR
jgi:hypothetical protein